MYKLSINNINSGSTYIIESSILWHNRLIHLNFRSLKFMFKHGLISYNHNHSAKCEICIQAKMTKKPLPRTNRNSKLLELVHSDVCELNGILTRGGNRYFITFTDDFSRYTYVYLMKVKTRPSVCLNVINLLLKIKMKGKLRYFVVIEVVNTFPPNLLYIAKRMILYIKLVHPIPHNKMVWQKEKIGH
jgi:hypothetical protein